MSRDDGSGKFLIGAIIGGLAGAIAGLVLAPRSGKETRKIIGDRAKDYAEKGKEIMIEKEKEAKSAIKKVEEKLSK